jgi:hypothetical protein
MKLKQGNRTGLKYFTMADIRSWEPCYDPIKYLPENFKGTAITILEDNRIPFPDRLWVVCRSEIISDRVTRLFAVWCARQVQHLMKDPRSLAALDVAERFAIGEATEEERYAAWGAAWVAEWYAARATAGDAARYAARATAGDAARYAAWGAAWVAEWYAARATAGDAAREAQKTKLIEMVRAEGLERMVVREILASKSPSEAK